MMVPAKLIARKPQGGSPRTWDFPRFTRTRLDSGLNIIAANAPGRALGAAQLILEAGASNEPDGQGGVAHLAAGALTEGTDHYKGPAFVQAVERLGGDIFAACDWDSFTVNLRAPIDRMEPALELMAEAVRNPTFSGNDVDRLKQQRMSVIMQEYAAPASRAMIAFNRVIYNSASPYSRSEHGEYWSVLQIGKGQVKKYYERFATPGSATLVVAGDLEGFPLVKIAEKLFGRWKGKEPERSQPLVQEAVRHTFVLVVNREEAEQSELNIGHVGVPRSAPDYFPLTVATTALGGMFNSRLNLRLREEKGFTYGAGAGFDYRRQAGPFRANSAVKTEVTVDAIAETIKVLESTREKGITKQELEEVKGFLVGIFPLRFETPQAITSGISSIVTHGLADDYYATFRAKIESVTLDEANQAAAEHLRPDRLAIVAVGDAEVIGDPLRNADFGPVAVIEDPEQGQPPIH